MHNATTKQRLSALRRKLGFFGGAPRWVRERRARLQAAAASMLGLDYAGAAEGTPVPALAAATNTLSATLPEGASGRWVSESMILPETRDSSQATTERVATADLVGTADGVEPREFRRPEVEPPEAAPRRFPWRTVAALAALAVAVAGLLLALRSRAPAPAERSAAVEAPALGAPLPAPAVAPAPAAAYAPVPPPPGSVLVRRGDTLWALAAAHLGDPLRWPGLHATNRGRIRDPDLIYPGQRLDVPAR